MKDDAWASSDANPEESGGSALSTAALGFGIASALASVLVLLLVICTFGLTAALVPLVGVFCLLSLGVGGVALLQPDTDQGRRRARIGTALSAMALLLHISLFLGGVALVVWS